MHDHRDQFSLERMSKTLSVPRSGYYQFCVETPSQRTQDNAHLLTCIQQIHQESRQTYGSPRIHAALAAQGHSCGLNRVARLMREAKIQAKMHQRYRKITTRSDPKAQAAPNLLQQDFKADEPNQRWVADITYVYTQEGWLYVASVMDLFSRRIVGLMMSDRINTDLVLGALKQACLHRRPPVQLIHHSDKGCQYTSGAFQAFLQQNQIICSMSGTGNCYDNAAQESFHHTLKTEHVYFMHYPSRAEAKASIFEYIEVFYNGQRRHSTLGYCSPREFEARWEQETGVRL